MDRRHSKGLVLFIRKFNSSIGIKIYKYGSPKLAYDYACILCAASGNNNCKRSYPLEIRIVLEDCYL